LSTGMPGKHANQGYKSEGPKTTCGVNQHVAPAT
jgi:hypothetical protein